MHLYLTDVKTDYKLLPLLKGWWSQHGDCGGKFCSIATCPFLQGSPKHLAWENRQPFTAPLLVVPVKETLRNERRCTICMIIALTKFYWCFWLVGSNSTCQFSPGKLCHGVKMLVTEFFFSQTFTLDTLQGCALRKFSGNPLGSQPCQLGCPALKVGRHAPPPPPEKKNIYFLMNNCIELCKSLIARALHTIHYPPMSMIQH